MLNFYTDPSNNDLIWSWICIVFLVLGKWYTIRLPIPTKIADMKSSKLAFSKMIVFILLFIFILERKKMNLGNNLEIGCNIKYPLLDSFMINHFNILFMYWIGIMQAIF